MINKFVVWKTDRKGSFFQEQLTKLIHALQLAPLLFRRAFAKNSILLHTADLRTIEMRLLHAANKISGGKTIGHMRATGDISRLQLVTKHKERQICQGDIFLYHTDKDLNWIRQALEQKMIVTKHLHKIGFPAFFDAWIRFISDEADRFLQSEFDIDKLRRSDIVLLLTSSIVPSKGCGQEDFEYLLRSAIEMVHNRIRDAFIVVKPHPVQKKEDFAFIDDLIAKYPVQVSYLHHALFSSLARLCITIFPTTAAIVPLSFKGPCIEYNRFTGEDYLNVLPDGSLNQDFGMPIVSDEIGLGEAIDAVLKTDYNIPDMKIFFQHKKKLSVFFEFA